MFRFIATKKPVDKPRKMLMRIINKSFVCAFSEPHIDAKNDKRIKRMMHTTVMILLLVLVMLRLLAWLKRY